MVTVLCICVCLIGIEGRERKGEREGRERDSMGLRVEGEKGEGK